MSKTKASSRKRPTTPQPRTTPPASKRDGQWLAAVNQTKKAKALILFVPLALAFPRSQTWLIGGAGWLAIQGSTLSPTIGMIGGTLQSQGQRRQRGLAVIAVGQVLAAVAAVLVILGLHHSSNWKVVLATAGATLVCIGLVGTIVAVLLTNGAVLRDREMRASMRRRQR